jgi:glycosyltransferase involved in cell wall biosynthesis
MKMSSIAEKSSGVEIAIQKPAVPGASSAIKVGLLTGCQDRHYAFALAMGLISKGICLDVVGSDEVDSPELHTTLNLRFLNFRGSQRNNANVIQKVSKLLVYYVRLLRYVLQSDSPILHILWNNELETFDRTIMMLFYRMCGKKVAFTAHNVNGAKRDRKDSLINRATLRIQYRLCDHIFVHTQKMKSELCHDFGVAAEAVTVLRYPINNAVPSTNLTPFDAKRHLGLKEDEKAILYFGKIRPYKGIEYLLDAFRLIAADPHSNYRLIVAGEPKKGSEEYLHGIERLVESSLIRERVMMKTQFIPDEEMELYFKAADVLVLPYKEIFQSGVLFLSYGFGLPVIATDVGSFREDIVEGSTGFLCKPGDPADMAKVVEGYFASELFKNLNVGRYELMEYANANHSWNAVADLTRRAYAQMLGRTP